MHKLLRKMSKIGEKRLLWLHITSPKQFSMLVIFFFLLFHYFFDSVLVASNNSSSQVISPTAHSPAQCILNQRWGWHAYNEQHATTKTTDKNSNKQQNKQTTCLPHLDSLAPRLLGSSTQLAVLQSLGKFSKIPNEKDKQQQQEKII